MREWMQNTVLRSRLCAFSLPVFNAWNVNSILVVIRRNPAIAPSVIRRVLTAGLGAEPRWHLMCFMVYQVAIEQIFLHYLLLYRWQHLLRLSLSRHFPGPTVNKVTWCHEQWHSDIVMSVVSCHVTPTCFVSVVGIAYCLRWEWILYFLSIIPRNLFEVHTEWLSQWEMFSLYSLRAKRLQLNYIPRFQSGIQLRFCMLLEETR
jgi:ABC-type multidrug transport system fused ATPase/permease subunit